MGLRVGISYGPPRGKYPNYHRAVQAAGARVGVQVETFDLDGAPERVLSIDGILLSGGPDVDPARYGMPEYAVLCNVDPSRDEREFSLLAAATSAGVPVFAICRGAQLLNVANGGTLIPDLPDATAIHHGAAGEEDRRHPVVVEAGAVLASIAGARSGDVNSHHHQAIDRVAAGFTVTARADDGTIEAFEWERPEGKPYLLAVQWHPERMEDSEPFAGPLFERFVTAVREHSEARV